METYRVRVFTPGQKIVLKGKVSRSPVTFSNVTKTDLALIEAQTRRSSLEYTVVKESDVVPQEEKKKIIESMTVKITEKTKVEELQIKEPSTILEKLIYENENKE